MSTKNLHWVKQNSSLGAAADLEYSTTILRAVQHGMMNGPVVRVYQPAPTVSFGQQDVRMQGYDRARHCSQQHDFTPVVRRVGGRAAAYHHGSVVIDHLQPEHDAKFGFRQRFEYFGELVTAALSSLGVVAAVGEIPGEYCAGEYSVHAVLDSGRRIKMAGTAQRVVRGAWLFSISLVVENGRAIRDVLTDVYHALDIAFDPQTAGSADEASPEITVDGVVDALFAQYQNRFVVGGHSGHDAYELVETPWSGLIEAIPPAEPAKL